jgi:carbon-monoxide dehydrogenase medium subunit
LDKVTINAPNVLYALEGGLVAKKPDGEQTIPALKFFKDYLLTTLDPQEVDTEVRVPKLVSNTGWSYKKFARRVGALGRRLVAGGGSG